MRPHFIDEDGRGIPSVAEDETREIDRIADEYFGLGILQMIENAGRNLASQLIDAFGGAVSGSPSSLEAVETAAAAYAAPDTSITGAARSGSFLRNPPKSLKDLLQRSTGSFRQPACPPQGWMTRKG